MFNAAIVIPVFQHGNVLGDTVLRLLPSGIPLIVVNDGRRPGTEPVNPGGVPKQADQVTGAMLKWRQGGGGN